MKCLQACPNSPLGSPNVDSEAFGAFLKTLKNQCFLMYLAPCLAPSLAPWATWAAPGPLGTQRDRAGALVFPFFFLGLSMLVCYCWFCALCPPRWSPFAVLFPTTPSNYGVLMRNRNRFSCPPGPEHLAKMAKMYGLGAQG